MRIFYSKQELVEESQAFRVFVRVIRFIRVIREIRVIEVSRAIRVVKVIKVIKVITRAVSCIHTRARKSESKASGHCY